MSSQKQDDLVILNDRIEQLEVTISGLIRVLAAINQRIPDEK
ncbi:MAG TPA: hypothetical protein VK142_11610 [Bacillota bacterium]|nr:hypothetical protein [Bacillota bacterium]